MFRYMIFLWDPADPTCEAVVRSALHRLDVLRAGWRCAFERPGLSVHCVGERDRAANAQILHGARGVILGTLFARTSGLTAIRLAGASFDAQVSARVVSTRARVLVNEYWGNYVAVVHDSVRNATQILRGPVSSLPCLRMTDQRVEILFSSMEDCAQLKLAEFSIDWEYITTRTVGTVQLTRRTGLNEVTQILPGECLESIDGKTTSSLYWDPLEIAHKAPLEDVHEAAVELNRTIRMCVSAWAECHDTILVSLSGGLDSSILLACLKDAPSHPRLICLTEYSAGADSDERYYARLAVRNAGNCALIEQPRDSHVSLRDVLGAARSEVPQRYVRRAERTKMWRQRAAEYGADAVFTGEGGDQILCQSGASVGVADFVYRHGVQRRLWRVVYEAAQLDGLSVWKVLQTGVRDGWAPRRSDSWSNEAEKRVLICRKRIHSVVSDLESDALVSSSGKKASPGMAFHIAGLRQLPIYYDAMALPDDPIEIAPFFSQPLVELTLRMPTYVLMTGGWDRGLARLAFSAELPPEISRRRTKGRMEEHMYEIWRTNLPFTRQLLLDGMLVRNGLLDPVKVEEALSGSVSGALRGTVETHHHLNTEVWLRMWCDCTSEMTA